MLTSDQFQSVVNVLAIAVVLAAVPIAATIGSETYVSARLASPGSGSTPGWLGIGTAVIVGRLSPRCARWRLPGPASSPVARRMANGLRDGGLGAG